MALLFSRCLQHVMGHCRIGLADGDKQWVGFADA